MGHETKPAAPPAKAPSLIERAGQSYDFGDLLKAGPAVPVFLPETQPVHAPAVQSQSAPHQETVFAPASASASSGGFATPAPQAAQPVLPGGLDQIAPKVHSNVRSAPRGASGRVAEIDLEKLREIGFLEPGAAPSTLSEEFRLAKRQILLGAFGGRNNPVIDRGRAILVCSSQPNEGKTFCSINLALSLSSERDIETVLVDADVAKPEVLSILGVEGGAGLMDAIGNTQIDIEHLLIQSSLPSLKILPTGRRSHDDTELLASARTEEIIHTLLANNPRRVVIIDCAPALAASPASVLAHHVGQIIMVVRADRTGESELRDAIGILDGCKHMQLLLNGATYSGITAKYGSYYGYGG